MLPSQLERIPPRPASSIRHSWPSPRSPVRMHTGAHAQAPRAEDTGEADGGPRPSTGHPIPPVRDPTPPQVLPRSSPDRPQVRKNPHWNVAPRACVGLKPARFAPFAFSLSGLDSVQRGLCRFKAGWRRCGPSTLCKALPHFRVKTCHQSCLATS